MNGCDTRADKRSPLDLFNAYVEFLKITFSNLFLMCAGSATALIAFVGTKPAADAPISSNGAANAIILFGCGAVFAVVAAGLVALQENINCRRVERNDERGLGSIFGYAGGFAALLSVGAFAFGCYLGVRS